MTPGIIFNGIFRQAILTTYNKNSTSCKKRGLRKIALDSLGHITFQPGLHTRNLLRKKKKNVLGQFKYDKNINNCNNNKIDRLIKDELSFNLSSIIAYF